MSIRTITKNGNVSTKLKLWTDPDSFEWTRLIREKSSLAPLIATKTRAANTATTKQMAQGRQDVKIAWFINPFLKNGLVQEV